MTGGGARRLGVTGGGARRLGVTGGGPRRLGVATVIDKCGCMCLTSEVLVITPHTQRERGKVIGCGVHIYIYIAKKSTETRKVKG